MLNLSDGSASAATIVNERPTPDNTSLDRRCRADGPRARGRPDSDREGLAKAVESLHEPPVDEASKRSGQSLCCGHGQSCWRRPACFRPCARAVARPWSRARTSAEGREAARLFSMQENASPGLWMSARLRACPESRGLRRLRCAGISPASAMNFSGTRGSCAGCRRDGA